MDEGKFKKLNKYHVIFLVQNVIVGMYLLTFPRNVSNVGYNGWWTPIVIGLIAQLTIFPMYSLCRKYPNDSFFTINEKLLGKFLGKCINLLLIIYALLTISMVVHP